MTNNHLRDAQRSFENLRQGIWEVESVVQKLFETLGEIEHRLEKIERRQPGIFTHHDGSEGTLSPSFDEPCGDHDR